MTKKLKTITNPVTGTKFKVGIKDVKKLNKHKIMKKNKIKKDIWFIEEEDFDIVQRGVGYEDTKVIPIKVAINKYTGEIKLFSKKIINNLGINYLKNYLNSEEGK